MSITLKWNTCCLHILKKTSRHYASFFVLRGTRCNNFAFPLDYTDHWSPDHWTPTNFTKMEGTWIFVGSIFHQVAPVQLTEVSKVVAASWSPDPAAWNCQRNGPARCPAEGKGDQSAPGQLELGSCYGPEVRLWNCIVSHAGCEKTVSKSLY